MGPFYEGKSVISDCFSKKGVYTGTGDTSLRTVLGFRDLRIFVIYQLIF